MPNMRNSTGVHFIYTVLLLYIALVLISVSSRAAGERVSILEHYDSWGAFTDRWKSLAANDIRSIATTKMIPRLV